MNTMRKKIVLFVCLILASLNLMAATRATILLLHNGNATSFDNNQLSDAMAAATHGDTIYLSEGAFYVDTLIVDKAITLMGAGKKTTIHGNVRIAIDGEPTLKNRVFDAVKITGEVKVTKVVKGLSFRKCWIGYQFIVSSATEAYMDRCYLHYFSPTDELKKASVVNSVINTIGFPSLHGDFKGNDLTFVNCSISGFTASGAYCNISDAAFFNCIIFHVTNVTPSRVSNTYVNTLISSGDPSSYDTFEKYYKAELTEKLTTDESRYPTFFYENKEITADALVADGFVGNDGTAVGHIGGSTPFNLTPSGINVTESLLQIDSEKKQLNVTLKINDNQ